MYLGEDLQNNDVTVFIKVFSKEDMQPASVSALYYAGERLNHERMNSNANVLKMVDYMYVNCFQFLVLEYCPKGNLADYIESKLTPLKEEEIIGLLKQMARVVGDMERNQIVHSDLQLRNWYICSDEKTSSPMLIKLGDFGFTRHYDDNQYATVYRGSIYYIAPETIKEQFTHPQAIWSLGIGLYRIMTGGLYPFKGESIEERATAITKGEFTKPAGYSDSLIDVLMSMLIVDPNHRITAQDLSHRLSEIEPL